MYVENLMTTDVKTCAPEDTLHQPAQTMWENDCGFLPVVDSERRLVGVITDRDICMAAYTQGVPLAATKVASAMTGAVHTCTPRTSLAHLEEMMRTHKLRRVPVVDRMSRLVGIVTLGDLARRSQLTGALLRTLSGARVARILANVCSPRTNGAVAAE